MRTASTFKALFLFALVVPFLASCSDDTVGPDDVSYPVTMVAKSIESKSTIRAFVREGDTWREITSENPEILTNEFFAEATVITADDDPNLVLTSTTEWQSPALPGQTFTYTYSGDKFIFSIAQFGASLYATGDYSTFKAHGVAGVVAEGGLSVTSRMYYASGSDPLNALTTSDFFSLPSEEGDTLAYQTFDIVYTAE